MCRMSNGDGTVRLVLRAVLAIFLVLPATASMAIPAPTAPATSTGNYTVSYDGCYGCYMHWLEESTAGFGAWVTVGQDTVSFTGKGEGAYDYRTVALFWDGIYGYFVQYSDITTVSVGADLPVAQSLIEQYKHRYVVRVGHQNADGRPDLFIERQAGGDGDDGTIRRLFLQAAGTGFSAIVPTDSAAAAAQAWPVADVAWFLRDVNIDGFVDLVIPGIGQLPGFPGMAGQIVYAPGAPLAVAPKAVMPIDEELREFGHDAQEYLANTSYFQQNAPVYLVTVSYFEPYCELNGFDVLLGIEVCYYVPRTAYFVVTDYSVFAEAAVRIWEYEYAIANGTLSKAAGYTAIETTIEDLLAVQLESGRLRDLLGSNGSRVEPESERGLELFAALAGIADAAAQEVDADGPDGDGEEGADEMQFKSDVVLLTGRRVIGFGPYHTALQYAQTTLSAYDDDPRALFDGTLVSQVNWPPDHPLPTQRLGSVASASSATWYWKRLLAADRGYGDDLRYDALPSLGAGGYNSNGFVSGIVSATAGVPSVPLERFVGGEVPVPASQFY